MTSSKKRGIALALMLSGFVVLPTILAVYAISTFVLATSSSGSAATGSFFHLLLTLGGIVGVLLFLIGIPVGIFLFVHANKDLALEIRGEEPYRSMPEDQFQFIMKPSWGAFFNAPAWAFCNKLYGWGVVALFVPIVQLYAWIRLFADGRRMAWQQTGWKSFEHFKQRQPVAAVIVAAVIVCSVLFSALIPVLVGKAIVNRFSQPVDPQGDVSSDTGAKMQAFICEQYSDADADGIPLNVERRIDTDPEKADTDGDGFADQDEIFNGYDPVGSATPAKDTDEDGVADAIEKYFWESDYKNADTDGDGQNDLAEVKAGTAPRKMGHMSLEDYKKRILTRLTENRSKNNCP